MPVMPKFESHCIESMALFGASFSHVHLWLDEFYGSEKYKSRHRRIRHHEDGIQMAVVLFGPECEPVARQHIISDLKTEGWKDVDPFPADEKNYIALWFW